jgi:predicted nuclease of predicted toxin-antitoxin system
VQFLADENLPAQVVAALRDAGHDVLSIREIAPGMKDEQVLQTANDSNALLLTCDKDFGELVYRRGMKATHGVVLFRLKADTPSELAELVCAAMARDLPWLSNLIVITNKAVRVRPLME